MIFPLTLLQFKSIRAYVLRSAEILTPTAQTSTNSLADVVGSKIDTVERESVAIAIKNTHVANSIDFSVLASIDDATYFEVDSGTLTAGLADSYTSKLAEYRYYKVQIKSSAPNVHGTGQVRVISK